MTNSLFLSAGLSPSPSPHQLYCSTVHFGAARRRRKEPQQGPRLARQRPEQCRERGAGLRQEDRKQRLQDGGLQRGQWRPERPSAGYNQAICCSLKDYGRCLSRQLGEDAQCKDWVGGVVARIEQKFADNCAAYKDVCSAGATTTTTTTTTLGAFLLLLYTLFTRLLSD